MNTSKDQDWVELASADPAAAAREIERLRAALQTNNHHLAKLVNGTDDDDPQTLEDARQQVLATREILQR